MLIEKWMMHEERGENKETHPWKINREELLAHKDKVRNDENMGENGENFENMSDLFEKIKETCLEDHSRGTSGS